MTIKRIDEPILTALKFYQPLSISSLYRMVRQGRMDYQGFQKNVSAMHSEGKVVKMRGRELIGYIKERTGEQIRNIGRYIKTGKPNDRDAYIALPGFVPRKFINGYEINHYR